MYDKFKRKFPWCTDSNSNSAPHYAVSMVLPNADRALAALEKPPVEPLWYLAYGSNLNARVFTGRRGIAPCTRRNVLVEGLELTFDLPGMPYVEPRFANCRFASSAQATSRPESASVLWETGKETGSAFQERNGNFEFDPDAPWTGAGALIGVAYLVTPTNFARVLSTEGGGSSYKMVAVDARVLTPEMPATRGTGSKDSNAGMAFTGEVIRAYTLLSPPEKTRQTAGEPSLRYLSLIRQGAEECALPLSYRSYLAGLTPYTPTTLRQKVGRALMLATWAPPVVAVMLFGNIFAAADGSYPSWLNNARERISRAMWDHYDKAWRARFGEGERAVEGGDV